ncbi:hypothetical protein D9M73_70980 [compost metagenome]
MHHHGIHGAFDVGNQTLGGHQAGVHTQLDALGRLFGDAQQFDAVAELLGVFDVLRAQFGDAFDVSLVELHRDAERNRRHQGDLVRGVHAFDVEGRIGLGITQALGLLEHHVKVQALVAHLAQDEIGGAIDDAGNPFDAVGSQTFTQRLDDGNATSHCSLKSHHHALAACGGKDLGAMHGQQGLVGRDHMLAGFNRFQYQLLCDAIAAYQLDHDVDFRVGNHRTGIGNHLHILTDSGLRTCSVQVRHHGDFNAATGAAQDLALVALQYVEYAAAYGAYAQKAYLDGFWIRQFRFHVVQWSKTPAASGCKFQL